MSAKIIGPFHEHRLVVDDWQVPLVEAKEQDGGTVLFVLDHRLGFVVSAGEFEVVADLVANAIAIALGLPCHPGRDETLEPAQVFAAVPHFALAPRRLSEITGVSVEEPDA